MTFFPLPAFNDNYIWVTQDTAQKQIWVVDPGDPTVVENYCSEQGVTLASILITHHHWDHTDGVIPLKERFDCPVYGPETLAPQKVSHPLKEGDSVTINGIELLVIATPGHTLDHLCYFGEPDNAAPILLCGDTLFRGGCGRLFEGSAAQMLHAMTRLRELPHHTEVYGTHEYTLSNYRFALAIDPSNKALQSADAQAHSLREQGKETLPSTIALEIQSNPFFRFDVEAVVSGSAQLLNESPASDLIGAFAQIRRAKDGF